MKKKVLIILSLAIVLIAFISACDIKAPTQSNTETQETVSPEEKIKELEAQIITLMQSQQLADTERKKEIAALEAKIEELKSKGTEAPTDTQQPESPKSFTYTIENGKAIITSINTTEETLTIPSVIDGYQVSAIGSQSLNSSNVKRVIISSGIEKLDWFAFCNCLNLSSVTIPDSVTSIGYGAFDNTARSLTIYCSRDSFAHKYAQSYGLTYDIT